MEADDVAGKNPTGAALTRDEIRRWMEVPAIGSRLVITPLLNVDESLGPSSLDVRPRKPIPRVQTRGLRAP